MSTTGNSGSRDLRQFLKKQCLVACEPQLKNEAVCDNFCEFVDHLFDEHGAKLVDTFNHLQGHGLENYETALEWSMDETVRFRRQTYSEDIHALGEYFMNAVEMWHSRLERGEEL